MLLEATHTFAFHVLAGDSNGDRSVDFVDFAELSANFGKDVGPLGPGDLNADAIIDFTDFGILSRNFGATVAVPPLDFGDAPSGKSYPTTEAENGPRHVVGGLFLGASVDDELNGQPDAAAAGDDNTGGDDEDGVSFAALQGGAMLALPLSHQGSARSMPGSTSTRTATGTTQVSKCLWTRR